MLPYVVLAIAAVAAIIGAAISTTDRKHEKTQLLVAFTVLQLILLAIAAVLHSQNATELAEQRSTSQEMAEKHAAQLDDLQRSHDTSTMSAQSERRSIDALLRRSELDRDALRRELDTANQQLATMSADLAKAAVRHETEILQIVDAAGGRVMAVADDGHITSLSFAESKLNDNTLVHVAKLSRLQILDLRKTAVTATGLKHIRGLTSLIELYLNDTQVDDLQAIAALQQLKVLELDYLRIPKHNLHVLRDLTNLEELSLYVVETVDDQTLPYLRPLANLRELRLSSTRITDDGLAQLHSFQKLEILGLSSTQISDSGVVHLTKLKNLKQLWLGYTNITDQSIITLSTMPELFNLHFDHTAVTDSSILALSRMPKLWHVDLRGTNVTAAGIKTLQRDAPKIRHIDR